MGHSPDSKWIAYQSDESGRFEVYVQSFPGPGPKTLVSTNGGAQPRWRHDSREPFYISPDDRLMAVLETASLAGTRKPALTETTLISCDLSVEWFATRRLL